MHYAYGLQGHPYNCFLMEIILFVSDMCCNTSFWGNSWVWHMNECVFELQTSRKKQVEKL